MLAARDVFGESGETRTSLAEIARRCNRSSQAIYRYFPDRRALFEAAVRSEDSAYDVAIRQVLRDVKFPFLTNARLSASVRLIPRFPLLHRVYRGNVLADLDLVLTGALAEVRQDELIAELRLGQRAGVVRADIEVPLVARWVYRIGGQVQMPRLLGAETTEGDLAALSYVLASAVFHPMPDLSTEEKRVEFGTSMIAALELAASGG